MNGIIKSENRITIPSSSDYIAEVDDFLESWLRKRNVPEDTIADMAIAVTELVNNAIKHGNKKDKTQKVILDLHMNGSEIQAIVIDRGSGFDPDKVADPVAPENLLKEIGRGIFIVRSLMDDIKFLFPPEGGTKVTITKKYSSRS